MSLTSGSAMEVDGVPVGGKQQVKDATKIDMSVVTDALYKAARVSYDPTRKTHLFHTGFGIKIDAGEVHIPFFNDTGVEIPEGKAINATSWNNATESVKGIIADPTNPQLSSAIIGFTSAAVPDQTISIATFTGRISNMDTSLLTFGPLYISSGGDPTNTRPTYPDKIVIIGSLAKQDALTGAIQLNISPFIRTNVSATASFTSQGIGSGTFYKNGFYDWSATDANLTQAAPSVTYGTVDKTYAAHVGIVPSAPGTVDTGQVGLRVNGIRDQESGSQLDGQTAIITDDITTLTANAMSETVEKFSGQYTLELYVVSGAPTTYNLDLNYGYSKYEDFFDRDATVIGFQALWQGNANDSGMNIRLLHHKSTGWTYAATGFSPGNGAICDRSIDQSLAGDVVNGEDGAYKCTGLTTFINSNTSEGIITEVTTTSANTIQTMDIVVFAVSEELV